MKFSITAGLCGALLLLSACGESRYNPGNWGWGGGGSSSRTPTLEPRGGYEQQTVRRPLVNEVVSLSVEDVPDGVVVTAVGRASAQGAWRPDLISAYEDTVGDIAAKDGEIVLEFRVVPPRPGQPVVNQQSREVTAGVFLSDQTLRGVGRITVVGDTNRRSSSR